MNNTQLVDLSMKEMLTVAGGDDADPRIKCFLLGAGFAVGILTGPSGYVWAALAGYEAYESGCLT